MLAHPPEALARSKNACMFPALPASHACELSSLCLLPSLFHLHKLPRDFYVRHNFISVVQIFDLHMEMRSIQTNVSFLICAPSIHIRSFLCSSAFSFPSITNSCIVVMAFLFFLCSVCLHVFHIQTPILLCTLRQQLRHVYPYIRILLLRTSASFFSPSTAHQ